MNNVNNDQAKENAVTKIKTINAVEGFDPMPLAIEINDMNEGTKRYRLPVMAQMAWFRLKYPEGRIAVTVKVGNNCFIAEARVYANYKDTQECYLAEGSASKGYLKDKPTVSPREWAQTAAIGIALRNAGFGLQFAVAGESYEDNAAHELPFTDGKEMSGDENNTTATANNAPAETPEIIPPETNEEAQLEIQTGEQPQSPVQPEIDPLEKAMSVKCPIGKYKDKTLGEMVNLDPKALAYVAKSGDKYGTEIADSAKLICENAVQQTSA